MNQEDRQLKNMDEILTEKELCELLGVKKSMISGLRYDQQLPFCKISNTNRIYLVRDVLNFIESKRQILNRGLSPDIET